MLTWVLCVSGLWRHWGQVKRPSCFPLPKALRRAKQKVCLQNSQQGSSTEFRQLDLIFSEVFCHDHIVVLYPRVNSQVSVYYWLQFSKRLTKLPSARFPWICFFWETWEHSGQMKSLLSVSITKKAKHLEVVPTTGQVSVFWSSAIDALQLRPSPQASDPEGSQYIWKDLESLLTFCWDR